MFRLKPNEIKFSQNSIKCEFDDGTSLVETFYIRLDKISVKNGKYYGDGTCTQNSIKSEFRGDGDGKCNI